MKCIYFFIDNWLVTFDGPIMNLPQIASFGVWAANSLPYEIMMALEPCAKGFVVLDTMYLFSSIRAEVQSGNEILNVFLIISFHFIFLLLYCLTFGQANVC